VFNNQSKALISYVKTRIVGFVCYTPTHLPGVNGQPTLFWNCAVVATHPDFRRQGIAKQLTLAVEGLSAHQANYVGFSNASGVQIDQHSKSIGYQILGQITQQVLVPCLSFCLYEVKTSFDLRTVIESLTSLTKNQVDFLTWRYVNSPKFKFQIVQTFDKLQILATFIVLEAHRAVEILKIVQVSRPCQTATLLQSVANYYFCHKFKVVYVRCLCNHKTNKILPRWNWKRASHIFLTVKTKDPYFLDVQNHFVFGGNIL
jgi:hypothetical protein